MTAPLVLTCLACAGLTFTLDPCRCTRHGDRFLVDGDPEPERRGEAYRDCQLCHGVGTVASACHECDQRGRRRAQLVLTVVNADTGAVASANIVPGAITPRSVYGRWVLPLTPVITELAAAVSATALTELTCGDRPLGEEDLILPRQWRPDLPAEQRDALVAEAIADHGHDSWRVFQGRLSAPPPVDPHTRLAQLCRLADQLHLDLVVEARHATWGGLTWDVRFDLPGAPVPTRARVRGDDLPAAVAATTVADAFEGFEPRNLRVPAYHLRPGARPPEHPEPVDLDQVERRVLRDADDLPGAQAIWRNGRWWHTTLRIGRIAETLHEEPTGQVTRRLTTILVRGWEPPAPDWRGAPIPYADCPDCVPGSRLRACRCRLGGRPVDPDCDACGGTGVRPEYLTCFTCGDSRRVYRGAVVTVTDLSGGVVHENWSTAPVTAPLVDTQPNGKPVVQLPERYRLARLATRLGQDPADLTDLDLGQQVAQDLRDGIVTLDHPGDDPLAAQLAHLTRGRPGGRLLLAARPAPAPPLTELVRIAHGLHLAVAITVQDHGPDAAYPLRVHGTSWAVEVISADPDAPFTSLPTQRSLAAAVATCVEYLELAIVRAVPGDPYQPVPVPQTPAPGPAPVADPGPLVARLGRHHAGTPVTVRLDRAGCTVHLHDGDAPRLLVRAPTLPAALTALGLPATAADHPD